MTPASPGPRPARRWGAAGPLCLAALLAGCAASSSTTGSQGASRPRVWRPAAGDTLGPTVALVGDARVTRHDVDSVLATVPETQRQTFRTPEGYRRIVDHLVDRSLAMQAAAREGIERDSAFVAEVEGMKRDLVVRHYFRRKFASMPGIPDSSLRALYDQNASRYEIPARARIRHIQLPTEAKAREALRKIKAGSAWDAVCSARSTDAATKGNGGLLGYVAEGSNVIPVVGESAEIAAAAFRLKEGETSQPIKSGRGWHLIRVDGVEKASQRSFESVRQELESEARTQQRERYGLELRDSLRAEFNAVVFNDSIEVALTPARTPSQFFEEAQAAQEPSQRIELYRKLIKRFPEDRVSMQAQFMIGFTYAEELGEYDLAREELQEFIRKYPGSDLAGSAQWMIDNMDKPNPTFEDSAPADSARPAVPRPAEGGNRPGAPPTTEGTPKDGPR